MRGYRVTYWLGTRQVEGHATTPLGAVRIARRNRNAFEPTITGSDGREYAVDVDPETGQRLLLEVA